MLSLGCPPLATNRMGGEIYFHRNLVFIVSSMRFDREETKSGEEKRKRGTEGRKEGKTFLGRRFLAAALRGSTGTENIKPRSLFSLDFERREPARLPFPAYNKLCMAEHFNSLVSSCV